MKKFEQSPIGKLFVKFSNTTFKVMIGAWVLIILIIGTPIIYWKSKSLYRDVKTSYIRWTIGFDENEYIRLCNDGMLNRFKKDQFRQTEIITGTTSIRVKYLTSVIGEPYVIWCENDEGLVSFF